MKFFHQLSLITPHNNQINSKIIQTQNTQIKTSPNPTIIKYLTLLIITYNLKKSQYNQMSQLLPITTHYEKYLQFKQQLLTSMIHNDPLSILQSGIFQQYQLSVFSSSILVNQSNYPHQMQSYLQSCNVNGINVQIISKKSYSCEHNDSKQSRNQRKIKRMEQQNKIDLMIWSNIMFNHFQSKKNQSKQYYHQLNNKQNNSHNSNNGTMSPTRNKLSKTNNRNTYSQLQKNILPNPQTIDHYLSKICNSILKNPTIKNIKYQINNLCSQFQQQNDKVIQLLNTLRKQNDQLHKKAQDSSSKQLQHIVQLKSLQKRLYQLQTQLSLSELKLKQKQQQLHDQQSNFNKTILLNTKKISQQTSKTNDLSQLKQKVAIDSIRRLTLSTLSKQKFDLHLKKQKLGVLLQYQIQSQQSIDFIGMDQSTQQTRCSSNS